VETVAEHFAAVRSFAPELVQYFVVMSIQTLRLADTKGSLTAEQRQGLLDVIRSQWEPFSFSQEEK
jgi:hypothetical protein